MRFSVIITIITFFVFIALCSESTNGQLSHDDDDQKVIRRFKRKGGKSSGRGKSSSRGSKPRQQPTNTQNYPYPKQPANNPNYNPSAPLPNQGHGQQMPNYNPGHGQQMPNYNPGGHIPQGQGYGQKSHSGGIGGILGSNTGKVMAGGAAGGIAGAVGGYWLGKKIGQLGHGGYGGYGGHGGMGHFGYFDRGQYRDCKPPKITEINGTYYVPYEGNENYDNRCQHFDSDPRHDGRYRHYFTNGHAHGHDFTFNLIFFIIFISFFS